MTPKEKAEELVSKYEICTRPIFTLLQYDVEKMYNKQCALIAVDEIMKAIPDASDDDSPYNHELVYWQEVKQEIENL